MEQPAGKFERILESTIFASRWLLAPFFIGLIMGIGVLLIKFVKELAALIGGVLGIVEHDTIISKQCTQTGRSQKGVGRMRYMVVLEQGPESFGAYVPDLPGCVAVGESEQEALELIQEAIEFHLEGLREDGIPIPSPHSSSRFVEVGA